MADELLQDLEAQKVLMIAVSTGGPRIQDKNPEYIERRDKIRAALARKNLEDPNPYADLWEWYGKWSSGDLPSYQSRRLYIAALFKPLRDTLACENTDSPSAPMVQPTGWEKVDRGVDKVRTALEQAKAEEDYQAIGLLCRETLISLAQAVYDPAKHLPAEPPVPSLTDANRMLQGYFAVELAGGSNQEVRDHAKASLKLANALQHQRTATFRNASLCAEASRTVVNIVAIISGKRDPTVEPSRVPEEKCPF
jgi:hypothetical protein